MPALLLAVPSSCRPAASPVPPLPCKRLGPAGDAAALAALHARAGRPLVVIGDSAWQCDCDGRRLGDDDEGRRLAGDDEGRRRAGDDERRRRADDDEGRRFADDDEGRRRADDDEGRRRAGDDEGRRLADDDEGRRRSGDEERRYDLGPVCVQTPACAGYVVQWAGAEIAVFDGARLRPAPDHCVTP